VMLPYIHKTKGIYGKRNRDLLAQGVGTKLLRPCGREGSKGKYSSLRKHTLYRKVRRERGSLQEKTVHCQQRRRKIGGGKTVMKREGSIGRTAKRTGRGGRGLG